MFNRVFANGFINSIVWIYAIAKFGHFFLQKWPIFVPTTLAQSIITFRRTIWPCLENMNLLISYTLLKVQPLTPLLLHRVTWSQPPNPKNSTQPPFTMPHPNPFTEKKLLSIILILEPLFIKRWYKLKTTLKMDAKQTPSWPLPRQVLTPLLVSLDTITQTVI